MTQPQYRTLVLASLIVGILGATLDFAIPGLVPAPFHRAQAEYAETVTLTSLNVSLLVILPGFCLALAGTYGLFRFRQWAPRISLIGSALVLLGIPFFGPTVMSGSATALVDLSSYLWGASVLVPYVPQYSVWFQGQPTGNSGEA